VLEDDSLLRSRTSLNSFEQNAERDLPCLHLADIDDLLDYYDECQLLADTTGLPDASVSRSVNQAVGMSSFRFVAVM